eukprot:53930-Amphidinium_carterae.7
MLALAPRTPLSRAHRARRPPSLPSSPPCSADNSTRASNCWADFPGSPPNIVGGNAAKVCRKTTSNLVRAQMRATVGRTPTGRSDNGLSEFALASCFGIKVWITTFHSAGRRFCRSPTLMISASCCHARGGRHLKSRACQPLIPGALRNLAFFAARASSTPVIGSMTNSGNRSS